MSALKTQIARTFVRLYTHPGLRRLRRDRETLVRKLTGRPAEVHYFHQTDDPYSHLCVQVLQGLAGAYDIRLILERNWNTLGPKLKGKLHVITGSLDTFYLEGAVALLKQSLEKLGSDAEVEIIPDKDHGSILDAALAERIDRGMNETLTRNGVK